MSTPTTFIKLDRNILSWGWFGNRETLATWIFILIRANISDRKFEGVPVKRGELVTSYNSIAEACNITYKQARTSVSHLVKTGEISSKPIKKFLLIRVLNYERYQNGQSYGQGSECSETAEYSHSYQINQNKFTDYGQDEGRERAENRQGEGNTIINKEIKKERSVCEKHAHGIFNNIFLTEDEYKDYRLRVRDIDTIIDELSEAVAAEPKKYANGDIKAWLNKFIRAKYGRMPERRKML